jgi:hypothetical protein
MASPSLEVWNLYSCACTDLSELEDAVSCDRKVQGKF